MFLHCQWTSQTPFILVFSHFLFLRHLLSLLPLLPLSSLLVQFNHINNLFPEHPLRIFVNTQSNLHQQCTLPRLLQPPRPPPPLSPNAFNTTPAAFPLPPLSSNSSSSWPLPLPRNTPTRFNRTRFHPGRLVWVVATMVKVVKVGKVEWISIIHSTRTST